VTPEEQFEQHLVVHTDVAVCSTVLASAAVLDVVYDLHLRGKLECCCKLDGIVVAAIYGHIQREPALIGRICLPVPAYKDISNTNTDVRHTPGQFMDVCN
jgi:hypothetical protein